MIKHISYCDRCGNEIEEKNMSISTWLLSAAEELAKGMGLCKTDYYVGIKEGPELDLCEKCLDELRDFMKAGREEKAEK